MPLDFRFSRRDVNDKALNPERSRSKSPGYQDISSYSKPDYKSIINATHAFANTSLNLDHSTKYKELNLQRARIQDEKKNLGDILNFLEQDTSQNQYPKEADNTYARAFLDYIRPKDKYTEETYQQYKFPLYEQLKKIKEQLTYYQETVAPMTFQSITKEWYEIQSSKDQLTSQ